METLRVVVAEDHDVMRTILVTVLKSEFQVIDVVDDGEQLLRSAVFNCPDVIVSNIATPLVDALEVRKQLLSEGIQIPFVFITILNMARLYYSPQDSSVGYVYKMDVLNELNSAVSAVTQRHSYLSKSLRRGLGR